MPSRTIFGSLNGNGEFWSNDPNGAFFRGTPKFSTTAPVVTVTSTQDTLPAIGSTVTCTYSSTQPGFWEVASNVPGATITESIDGLSATITFVPQAYPVCSIYVAARCWNAGGSSIGVARVHPGMRGVIMVGSGWTYSNLVAAFAAVKAFANPGGYAFVVKNGTYTADNMHMFQNGTSSTQTNLPPCGEYTTNSSGADPVYTITRFTTVMAETPFGVIFDGQGTRDTGIELYGNTRRETDERTGWDFGGEWHLTAAGTQLRGIHIAGFCTINNMTQGFNSYYCDHIFYEYGLCGKVTQNSSGANISFQNSLDCVMENMHSFGKGRYKHSSYQSKRLAYRRLFGRFDEFNNTEPHAGLSLYRARYAIAQNGLYFDTDQFDEFNTGASQDAGMLAYPATDAYDYPQDHYTSKILGINNQLGFIENDSRDITSGFETFVFKDIGQWYYKPDASTAGGVGLALDGPVNATRVTSVYCDTINADYGCWAYRKPQTFNDSIIYKFGYSYAGAARANTTFVYNDNSNAVSFVNTTLYDLSYATLALSPGGGITYTNPDYTTDPTTQGMRYPGRIEPGSNYDTLNRGQDNFFKSEGRRGYNWGMSGDKDEVGDNWLAQSMIELALPLYRAHSHTGPTNTLGTQTLTGNRGGAMTDKLLIDYVISKQGRDIPFPLSVRIQKVGVSLRVSWRLFASAYMTNITGWRVYLDGGLAQIASPNHHAVDFDGLISGRTYKFRLQAVSSVHGNSGYSYEFEAVA